MSDDDRIRPDGDPLCPVAPRPCPCGVYPTDAGTLVVSHPRT